MKSETIAGSGIGDLLAPKEIEERNRNLPKWPYEDWAGPILGTAEAAKELKLTEEQLEAMVSSGEVIVLPRKAEPDVIPMHQFQSGQPIPGIKEVLEYAATPVCAWRFLICPHIWTDGATPISWLKTGRIKEVLEAAESNLAAI